MNKHNLMLISNCYKGLSLLEVTLVLLIISILFTGLLSPLHAQLKASKYITTQQRLDTAVEALIGFAIVQGRLPCPADPTLATGTNQAGEEARDTDGTCDNQSGVLPWVDLGVVETDAWQRRFTYRVTGRFADDNPESGCDAERIGVSFALCSKGNLSVKTSMASGQTVAKYLPAVIVSHGENGDGAYLPSGIQLLLPPHDSDEQQNFKKQVNFVDAQGDNDDLLAWLSPNVLAYRLVQAGVLP